MRNLPGRLLSVGMLLTILLGALGALVVFRQLSVLEAGILAAILAPTDAGLGQIIVNNPRVPMKIRQALNVEAGLNDGLSVPFLLFSLWRWPTEMMTRTRRIVLLTRTEPCFSSVKEAVQSLSLKRWSTPKTAGKNLCRYPGLR